MREGEKANMQQSTTVCEFSHVERYVTFVGPSPMVGAYGGWPMDRWVKE